MNIDFPEDSYAAPVSPRHPPTSGTQLFSPGRIVITSNALGQLEQKDILPALRRHLSGDWGELDEHDRAVNERAVRQGGGRLVSVYHSAKKVKFYVITEADRSVTTILLPEDY